jgi:hypothetical protein
MKRRVKVYVIVRECSLDVGVDISNLEWNGSAASLHLMQQHFENCRNG